MDVFFRGIQSLSIGLGKSVSKLYPLMILLIFTVVILRYFFGVDMVARNYLMAARTNFSSCGALCS